MVSLKFHVYKSSLCLKIAQVIQFTPTFSQMSFYEMSHYDHLIEYFCLGTLDFHASFTGKFLKLHGDKRFYVLSFSFNHPEIHGEWVLGRMASLGKFNEINGLY